MSKGIIYNYGDAFSIAYVMPTNRAHSEVCIHHSYGGILLFEHIITTFPELRSAGLPVIRRSERNVENAIEVVSIASNAPQGAATGGKAVSGALWEVPMRISYYLKQKDPMKANSPWLMADSADRPAMLHVRENATEHGRPQMPVAPPSIGERSDNATVFERITEHPKNEKAEGLRQSIPAECRNWVRFVSPINDSCQAIAMGEMPPPVNAVTEGMCTIVSARQLAATMRVRLQSSYEAMAVDLIRAWDWNATGNRLRFASLFGCRTTEHLEAMMSKGSKACYAVCRLPGGALLIYGGSWPKLGIPPGEKCDVKAYLVFDRSRPADIRQVSSGTAKGTGMLVAAAVVNALAQPEKKSFLKKLLEGSEMALLVTTDYLDNGVAGVIHNLPGESGEKQSKVAGKVVKQPTIEVLELDVKGVSSREHVWSIVGRKLQILADPERPFKRLNWGEIFSQRKAVKERRVIAGENEEDRRRQLERDAYYRAGLILLSSQPMESVSLAGKTAAGPRETISEALFREIPLVRFGDLELIDREEIQDYLAIQSILLNYLESRARKPLNLGVFGPPGSGKSFGTKEILKHIGKGGNTFQDTPNEFNLSQFRSLDDLAQALHTIRDEGLRDKMPVAFFDEFDSAFQGHPYGWLQYLLAPMQDGKFWENGREYSLGKCVLVFAGGVNRRFEEMNGRLRDPGFCAAKGPDFISRLRGVLNIKGVNRPDERSDQGHYLLRRAVLLRSMVSRAHKDAGAPVPEPLMDAAAAEAFLKIDGFRHGNRSMEAILRMSHLQPGKTLRAAELPPLEQLEIHVDGKHFTDFVSAGYRGSESVH